jgi:hypothetical protein
MKGRPRVMRGFPFYASSVEAKALDFGVLGVG